MMRKLTVPFLLILVLLLSACFRNAGGDDASTAQPVSLSDSSGAVVQPAVELTPTDVLAATPTELAVEPTQMATEEIIEETVVPATATTAPRATATSTTAPLPTATRTVMALATFTPILSGQGGGPEETEGVNGEGLPLGEPTRETFNATEVAVAQATNTTQPTNTLLPTSTLLPSATSTPQPTNTVQPSDTPQPTSTQVSVSSGPTLTTVPLIDTQGLETGTEDFGQGGQVVEVTATTVTIATEVGQLPTNTPPVGQLTVNQMTATAVIANATATQAAIQTQAAGGVVQQTPQPGVVGQTPIVVTQGPTAVTTDCEYLVQIGETLSEIARRYGLSIEQIANYNSITNPNLIRAGYPLIIPGCGQVRPTATPGATLIATTQAGTAQPLDNRNGPFTYTVQAGDNIYRISLRYGITMRELLTANPQITNMNFIREGQQITVPGPPTQLTPVPTTQVNVVQPTQQPGIQVQFTPTWTPQS